MSENHRIYVDMDDVLCRTARAFLEILKSAFGKTISFEDITSFDLGKSFNLSPEELEEFMRLGHQPDFLSAVHPIEGAVDSLHEFISLGYEIEVVTGRPVSTKPVTLEWLSEHDVPYHHLTFVDKYQLFKDAGRHPDVITLEDLTRRDFKFAVEDSGEMAVFISESMAIPVALLDRPWNRNIKSADPASNKFIERCLDWSQIVKKFGK